MYRNDAVQEIVTTTVRAPAMATAHLPDSSPTSTDDQHPSNSEAASSRDPQQHRYPKSGIHPLKMPDNTSSQNRTCTKNKSNVSTSVPRIAPCPVCGGIGRTRPNSRKYGH
jgi:hypothetical protein